MSLDSYFSVLPAEKSLAVQNRDAERALANGLLSYSPWIGLILAALIVRFAPYVVSLDPAVVNFSWRGGDWTRLLVVTLFVPASILAWRALLEWEGRQAVESRTQIPSAVLAFALVLLLGWIHEQRALQWYFLEAVKVRAAPFSLPRSVAYWKSGLLGLPQSADRAGMSLVGSSQLNMAIDTGELQQAVPTHRIWKNTLPGFGILQYLMVIPILEKQRAAKVIVMLSEFDAYRDDRIPTERLRYFGSWSAKATLLSLLPPSLLWANRTEIADLLLAGLTPLWRDRDLFSVLLDSGWWKAPGAEGLPLDLEDRIAKILAHGGALTQTIKRTPLVDVNFASFEAFVGGLRNRGIELVVYEGKTNPLVSEMYDPGDELGLETRNRLSAMARANGFTFVPLSQQPSFRMQDFDDAVHLNGEARKIFTHYLIARNCGQTCIEKASLQGYLH